MCRTLWLRGPAARRGGLGEAAGVCCAVVAGVERTAPVVVRGEGER